MSESRERFIERMQKRSAKLINQGELSLQEMLNAYEVLERQRDNLLDALTIALPYVESAETDAAYKPGHVGSVTRRLQAAIAAVEPPK